MSVPPRDLSPLLRWLRNLMLGRKMKNPLRFQDALATRSPPPPNLPEGPSHKLSDNYYFARDGRHAARPPLVLISETQRKAIAAGTKENTETSAVSSKRLGSILPGIPYEWKEAPKKSVQ